MSALLAAFLAAACVQTIEPLHLDERLRANPPESIVLMPVLDARAGKFDHVLITRDVRTAALRVLESKGYEVSQVAAYSKETRPSSDELAAMDAHELRALAPVDAEVFMVLRVEAVEADDGPDGPGMRVVLSGLVIDRETADLLWRDRTTASNELSGLMTALSRGSVRNGAAVTAVRNLLSTLPSRAKPAESS